MMIDLSKQLQYADMVWDNHLAFKKMFIKPYCEYIDLIHVEFHQEGLRILYVPDEGQPTNQDITSDQFHAFLEMIYEKS